MVTYFERAALSVGCVILFSFCLLNFVILVIFHFDLKGGGFDYDCPFSCSLHTC